MFLSSSTALPLWLRSCIRKPGSLEMRLFTPLMYCSAWARTSAGNGLLEAGLRLRWMARRSSDALHWENGLDVSSPFLPGNGQLSSPPPAPLNGQHPRPYPTRC